VVVVVLLAGARGNGRITPHHTAQVRQAALVHLLLSLCCQAVSCRPLQCGAGHVGVVEGPFADQA